MTLDKLFLSLHVLGALMWIGSLVAVMAFLEAVAGEPDAAARGRLLKHLRAAAIVPNVGAGIAIVFGAHWLFKFKLYEVRYLQLKLVLVAFVIALHGMLQIKARRARKGEPFTAPSPALKPALSITALGIILFVVSKWPLS
jgi:putative copper export protein